MSGTNVLPCFPYSSLYWRLPLLFLGMSSIIEIVMLSAAAIILIVTKTDGIKATQGSVFPAGMQAVIAIFGIAWMGDTFLQGNMAQLTLSIEGVVRQTPWLFGIALFVMSIQPLISTALGQQKSANMC